jgi:hypothetical protein
MIRGGAICFCLSGGMDPVSLPLFQGIRFGAAKMEFVLSSIVVLLGY